ncbi:hypothetical protein S245_059337 [Arachis hypogaea]
MPSCIFLFWMSTGLVFRFFVVNIFISIFCCLLFSFCVVSLASCWIAAPFFWLCLLLCGMLLFSFLRIFIDLLCILLFIGDCGVCCIFFCVFFFPAFSLCMSLVLLFTSCSLSSSSASGS